MNNDKPLFVISSPFDCYSGYSARSRDIIKAIIELDKYNVKLIAQNWGNTPWNFCKEHPEWEFLLSYLLPQELQKQKPDIWMQITIPSEFQPLGKYNIGCTAGIEATACPADWIVGLNRMDYNFVSSNFSKQVFETVKFEQKDNNTQQVTGVIQLQKPIKVIFEGANTSVYNRTQSVPFILDEIKEDFAYLFCGLWMQGSLGHDRKNVGLLVKSFLETFKNKKKKPCLILKTSTGNSGTVSRDEILKRILAIRKTVNSKNLPNIYVLDGEIHDAQMNSLYNHPRVKAMISLTKGEGFGRPLLEFSLSGKPIITSGWSGHVDFLKPEMSVLLPGELENIHDSASNKWLIKEAQWFKPDYFAIGHYLRDVFEDYKTYLVKGKKQNHYSKTNFSWGKMKILIDETLDEIIPDFPKEVELKLPNLKLPKLTNKPLPKLNKI